jgi:hypothetical protein
VPPRKCGSGEKRDKFGICRKKWWLGQLTGDAENKVGQLCNSHLLRSSCLFMQIRVRTNHSLHIRHKRTSDEKPWGKKVFLVDCDTCTLTITDVSY